MSSIIEGYNYDIFISYRQKDNKGDRWVSEFVDSLKTELESTFKEEISVYFDINPHDGLLETHDVNESLKEKLKCLVFIPIISRTYCDPKSFAWEHEFKAFVEQASEDRIGLKVKLPGGNVASRVIPVRIHDLDNEDLKLCESILEGVLRGIEFIYKEPGVNRSLTPEDDEKINLNKTKYRNQINKVALAIKEIITAVQNPSQQDEITDEVSKPVTTHQKSKKTPIIIASVAALALMVLGIIFIPKLFKPSEELEKSIAVLPFRNDSPDQEMYFINGVMEVILDNLCKIEEIRVVSRSSVEQYRDEPKPIPVVAKEMDVGYVLEGSGQRDGDNIRLTVQLLNGKKDQHIWSESYYREIKNIFELQSEIAQAIASELKAIITPEEKQLIEKIPTINLTAYDFYQRGRDEYLKYQFNNNREALERAEDYYYKALDNDSTFALAYTDLANIYWNKHYYEEYFSDNFMDSVLILCQKALSYDDQLAEAYTLMGRYYDAIGKPEQALIEYDKAIKFNPNHWEAYLGKGNVYLFQSEEMDMAIYNLHQASILHRGSYLPSIYRNIANAYRFAGFLDQVKSYAQKALEIDDDSARYYNYLADIEFDLHNYDNEIEFRKKAYAIDSNNISALSNLGRTYVLLKQYKESLIYYKKWNDRLSAGNILSTNYMHRIGYSYSKNGYEEKAKYYFNLQINYCEEMIELNRRSSQNLSVYYDLAAVYAFLGDKDKAYKNLRMFNQRQVMAKWAENLINIDPLFDSIRDEPEFQQIASEIITKYQAEHERVKKWLEENDML